MEIKKMKLKDLNRATYNPRVELRPGDADYEALEQCIEHFGMVLPVVWNKCTGNLVGGHQRLTVLENKGITEVDVSVVDIDVTKEKALNIALNKISGNWDEEKLVELLDELGDRAEETGFTLPEIEMLKSNLDDILDNDFLDDELARLEDTYNLSLSFDRVDKMDLLAYVSEYGKSELVKLIISRVEEGVL